MRTTIEKRSYSHQCLSGVNFFLLCILLNRYEQLTLQNRLFSISVLGIASLYTQTAYEFKMLTTAFSLLCY